MKYGSAPIIADPYFIERVSKKKVTENSISVDFLKKPASFAGPRDVRFASPKSPFSPGAQPSPLPPNAPTGSL